MKEIEHSFRLSSTLLMHAERTYYMYSTYQCRSLIDDHHMSVRETVESASVSDGNRPGTGSALEYVVNACVCLCVHVHINAGVSLMTTA